MDTKLLKKERKIQVYTEKLTSSLLPKGTQKEVVKKVAGYAQNLIKSTFPVYTADKVTIVKSAYIRGTHRRTKSTISVSMMITKKVSTNYSNLPKIQKDKVLQKVQNLYLKLSKKTVLKKKSSMLRLLYLLSKGPEEVKRIENNIRLQQILEERLKKRNDCIIEQENKLKLTEQDLGILKKQQEEEAMIEKGDNEALLLELIELMKTGSCSYIQPSPETDGFEFKIKLKLRPQIVTIVMKMAEVSKIVLLIREMIQKVENEISQKSDFRVKQPCLTKKEFIGCMERILATFDHFLGEIQSTYQPEKSVFGLGDGAQKKQEFMTFMTFYNLMQEPLIKMINAGVMAQACRSLNDCHILSALNSYKISGSVRLRNLANTILSTTIEPFKFFLVTWINSGEVDDPMDEFFIRKKLKKCKIWEDDCEILYGKIPSLFDGQIAEVIFKTGMLMRVARMLNLDLSAQKSGSSRKNNWVSSSAMEIEDPIDSSLKISSRDLNLIESSIETFRGFIHSHALKVSQFITKAYLKKSYFFDTFDFIHRTFLMRNGDFFDSMIHGLDPVLTSPASEVYFHKVMPLFRDISEKSSIGQIGLFKGGRRSKISIELLDNFGVKFLEKSDGDSGWDVFCLEFRFPDVLRYIVTDKIELKLLRFNHYLLKVRRAYYKLNSVWLHQKEILKDDIKISAYRLVVRCNLIRLHMSQFINNLSSYIFNEVIASEYQVFEKGVKKSTSLDTIRKQIDTLFTNLLYKSFLVPSPVKNEESTQPRNGMEELATRKVSQIHFDDKTESLESLILRLVNQSIIFSDSFLKIAQSIHNEDGSVNRYFPVNHSSRLIQRIWEKYEESYYKFLLVMKGGGDNGLLQSSAFKFDFNEFHVNHYEVKMGKKFFDQIMEKKGYRRQ